jgi:hypothetical protein
MREVALRVAPELSVALRIWIKAPTVKVKEDELKTLITRVAYSHQVCFLQAVYLCRRPAQQILLHLMQPDSFHTVEQILLPHKQLAIQFILPYTLNSAQMQCQL